MARKLGNIIVVGIALIGALIPAAIRAEESVTNKWVFSDEVEERGWSIKNNDGKSLFVMGCLFDQKQNRISLTMSGYMEELYEGSEKYWIRAGFKEPQDALYSAPDDYFVRLFMFSDKVPTRFEDVTIKVCAQSMSEIEKTSCQSFSAKNFQKVFNDLCLKPKGR